MVDTTAVVSGGTIPSDVNAQRYINIPTSADSDQITIQSEMDINQNLSDVSDLSAETRVLIYPTLEVGDTITALPGTPAKVENIGTDRNAVLQFTIPVGSGDGEGGGGGIVVETLEKHITDMNNPHKTTAEQVGTYTKEEIDKMSLESSEGSAGVLTNSEILDIFKSIFG